MKKPINQGRLKNFTYYGSHLCYVGLTTKTFRNCWDLSCRDNCCLNMYAWDYTLGAFFPAVQSVKSLCDIALNWHFFAWVCHVIQMQTNISLRFPYIWSIYLLIYFLIRYPEHFPVRHWLDNQVLFPKLTPLVDTNIHSLTYIHMNLCDICIRIYKQIMIHQ